METGRSSIDSFLVFLRWQLEFKPTSPKIVLLQKERVKYFILCTQKLQLENSISSATRAFYGSERSSNSPSYFNWYSDEEEANLGLSSACLWLLMLSINSGIYFFRKWRSCYFMKSRVGMDVRQLWAWRCLQIITQGASIRQQSWLWQYKLPGHFSQTGPQPVHSTEK